MVLFLKNSTFTYKIHLSRSKLYKQAIVLNTACLEAAFFVDRCELLLRLNNIPIFSTHFST